MGLYRTHLQVTWVGLILSEMAPTSAVAAGYEVAAPTTVEMSEFRIHLAQPRIVT